MERESGLGYEALRRAALDYELSGRGRADASRQRAQAIPVNVYESEEHLVVVAPMPGVEASDIDIEVHGTTLSIRAGLRGPGQQDRRYLLLEWTYGPYARTIELPFEVDAARANASHDNGVLALTLPKAHHLRAVRVPLRQAGSSRSRHKDQGRRSADE